MLVGYLPLKQFQLVADPQNKSERWRGSRGDTDAGLRENILYQSTQFLIG